MYGLVMIVKDAAVDLPRTLAVVRPHIGHWSIVDTGSTDGTQALIHELLDGVPGTLVERPWVNFGHNRSEAFALGRGTADWLLLLDADMAVTIEPGFVPDQSVDAYMLEMGNHTDFSYRLPLLVRGDLPWISVGAVHEYTVMADGRMGVRTATDGVRVDMGSEDRGSPEKYAWHLKMLVAEHRKNPTDARTVYYIGQTYASLGRKQARKWFQKRATMGGFAEEAYYAAYRAAVLAPDWTTQMDELLAAWEMRPQRLEALHALVRGLNERSMHQAAYALASIVPVLCTDNLFVHRSIWDWGMKFERSIAAWWVGHREESRLLGEELLDRPLPDHIREAVLHNLSFAESKVA